MIEPITARRRTPRIRRTAALVAALVAALTASICFAAPSAHAQISPDWPEAPTSIRCVSFDVPSRDKTLVHWGETPFGNAAVFVDGSWVTTATGSWALIDRTDGAIHVATWIRPVGIVVAACPNPNAPSQPATNGVNLFSAGTGDLNAPFGTCTGVASGDPSFDTVTIADRAGELRTMGRAATSILNFAPGERGEAGRADTEDTTIAEVNTGLGSINDFGYLSTEGDDDANASLGTGGTVSVDVTNINGRDAVVRADGVKATGELGSDPATPGDNLDGHEIFIFEDGELSGMEITLHSSRLGQAPYTISVADLERNPNTAGAADDTMIAIDLDSLPSEAPRLVDHITVTDDGISRGGVSTCDVNEDPNLVETSVELDAIAVARSAIRTIGAAVIES